MPAPRMGNSFLEAVRNPNSWLFFVLYGSCFGVELIFNNVAATYFNQKFGLGIATSAAIASSFGFMNYSFVQQSGGILSDYLAQSMTMRGRLLAVFICLLMQGLMIVTFSQTTDLAAATVVVIIVSIFTQAAEGAVFSVVPIVDPPNLGLISGIVGGGGNFGAVLWG